MISGELREKDRWTSSSLLGKILCRRDRGEIVLSGRSATIGLYEKPKAKDVENAKCLLRRFKCSPSHRALTGLCRRAKRKVLIARALAGSPRLLVMDEPCEGLDVLARERVLSLIELDEQMLPLPH